MKIFKDLFKGWKKPISQSYAEYYSLDDITVFAFDRCILGEFQYINKDAKVRDSDVENWSKCYDAFIKKFGQSAQFEAYLNKKKRLINFKLQFAITGDVAWLDQIFILEKQIEADTKGDGMTYSQALVILSKIVGYRLDPKQITILEYKDIEKQHGRIN
jgi:hypothetical protein